MGLCFPVETRLAASPLAEAQSIFTSIPISCAKSAKFLPSHKFFRKNPIINLT
jgi:hypothetical protein